MPQSKPITTLVVVSRRLPVTSSPESTTVQNAPPQNIRVVQSRIVSLTFLRCENEGVGLTALLARSSEEHTSELQSLMRISYAVFCLQKKNNHKTKKQSH